MRTTLAKSPKPFAASSTPARLESTSKTRCTTAPHSLYDLDVAVDRVRAAREAADSAGVPIVINARTDVYLLGIGEPDTRFEHAIRRANAYRKAGADCLFLPAVARRADIERIVPALDGPLNLLAFPGIPTIPELERLGVARLSVGTRLTLNAMSALKKTVAELLSTGTYESMLEGDDHVSPTRTA